MPLEKIEAGLASICPLKRVAVPQDIGRVVAFLASEEGEWINGLSTRRGLETMLTRCRPNNQAQRWFRCIEEKLRRGLQNTGMGSPFRDPDSRVRRAAGSEAGAVVNLWGSVSGNESRIEIIRYITWTVDVRHL